MPVDSFSLTVAEMVAIAGALLALGGVVARVEFHGHNIHEIDKRHQKELADVSERAEKETRERTEEAKRIAIEAHTQCAVVQSGLSLFREQVARDYVNREMIREHESRISADIDRISASVDKQLTDLSKNIKEAVDKLSTRLDRVLETREGRGRSDRQT